MKIQCLYSGLCSGLWLIPDICGGVYLALALIRFALLFCRQSIDKSFSKRPKQFICKWNRLKSNLCHRIQLRMLLQLRLRLRPPAIPSMSAPGRHLCGAVSHVGTLQAIRRVTTASPHLQHLPAPTRNSRWSPFSPSYSFPCSFPCSFSLPLSLPFSEPKQTSLPPGRFFVLAPSSWAQQSVPRRRPQPPNQ